ncbi:GDP-mannose 4,6-dehydratase [Pedobacter sp. 22163]
MLETLLENDSKLDPKYIRPTEVDGLLGGPTKSKTQFGWEPKYN